MVEPHKATPAAFGLEEVRNPNNKSGPHPETRAHLGAANDKAATGLQVVDGVFIQVLGRHHDPDDLLLQGHAHVLQRHVFVVLHGDDNGVDAHGDDCAIVLHVLNRHLSVRRAEGDIMRPRLELRTHCCQSQIPRRQAGLPGAKRGSLSSKGLQES